MKNIRVLHTNLCTKAKSMFLPILLIASLFSCQKEEFQEAAIVETPEILNSVSGDITNLIFQETFEGSVIYPKTGTTLNKIYENLNCNGGKVSTIVSTSNPTTLGNYNWTLAPATDAVYQGTKSIRYELRKDMPLVGSAQRHRVETTVIRATDDIRFTPELWYSFAAYFPSKGTENDNVRDMISQWWEDGSDETTIRMEQGKAFLEVTPPAGVTSLKKYDLFAPGLSTYGSLSSFVSIPRDTWNEFVFHIIHNTGSAGLIEVWRNGVKIHHITGRNMHLKLPKWNIGIYKSGMFSSPHYSRVMYFDNVRIGKSSATLEDMMSSSTPPPPPPTNILPSVNITGPANNATFTAPASVAINASATDSDGTISSVAFYNGSTLLGTDNSSPYSYTWSNVAAGNYNITARATDNAGGVTTSAPVAISVVAASNSAPSVNVTSPLNNASFNAPASVTINASASDADGTVSSVAFYNGTTLLGSDNSSPYSFTWSNVAAGNYTITARATDNAGATTTSSPVAFSVVAPPPTGALTITSFTLINSGTERDIMTITDGATISISQTGAPKFNIRANPSGTVDRVDFVLSGRQSKTSTDSRAPYALMGDDGNGNYYYGNWNPPALGTYTLKATPVRGTTATVAKTITFTFVQ